MKFTSTRSRWFAMKKPSKLESNYTEAVGGLRYLYKRMYKISVKTTRLCLYIDAVCSSGILNKINVNISDILSTLYISDTQWWHSNSYWLHRASRRNYECLRHGRPRNKNGRNDIWLEWYLQNTTWERTWLQVCST